MANHLPKSKGAMKETLARVLFICAACISILAVFLICIFLFANGLPGMFKIGVLDFLTGTKWKPGNNIYGILPMILGSVYVTAGALIIGVPAGLLTAIFLSRFASGKPAKMMRSAVSLLAGIPSVVYGFFGLVVIVPLIRTVFGGSGSSLLAACILLGMMILPTIITLSESALNAVRDKICDIGMASRELKESELAAGIKPLVIAMDGIAVIVSNDNPVTGLTADQVRAIYMGEITDWSEVNG